MYLLSSWPQVVRQAFRQRGIDSPLESAAAAEVHNSSRSSSSAELLAYGGTIHGDGRTLKRGASVKDTRRGDGERRSGRAASPVRDEIQLFN